MTAYDELRAHIAEYNDLDSAAVFYDRVLAEFGAKRIMEMERTLIWGNDPKKPMLAACKPFDGKPATAGNGTMVALAAKDPDMVRKVYQTALEQGARDEGEPGPRSDQFYGAYFRDPDGNALQLFETPEHAA